MSSGVMSNSTGGDFNVAVRNMVGKLENGLVEGHKVFPTPETFESLLIGMRFSSWTATSKMSVGPSVQIRLETNTICQNRGRSVKFGQTLF